ncbi:MAG: hypothetical protein OXB92_01160 [Acidimicrobiaceae bacterium]|nr:hypothetical protein [Acidimicrobiia bacterium]MCY4492450.1 hypothetical protein [Acidimicrobiaceae bacterium]
MSRTTHAPVVPTVGVEAQDRVQVTALNTGPGIKRNPDGINALRAVSAAGTLSPV